MIGLLKSAAGFVPGVGSLAALANPTVIAVLSCAVIASYCTGEFKGAQRIKAACVAATEKAKADATALDRTALEEQIAQERETNAELQADINKSKQEIAEYEALRKNDTCRVNDGDVAGGL